MDRDELPWNENDKKKCGKCGKIVPKLVICVIVVVALVLLAFLFGGIVASGNNNMTTLDKVKQLSNRFVSLISPNEQLVARVCFADVATLDVDKTVTHVTDFNLALSTGQVRVQSKSDSTFVTSGWIELHRSKLETQVKFHIDSNVQHLEQVDVTVFAIDRHFKVTSSGKLTLCTDSDYSRMCMKSTGVNLFGTYLVDETPSTEDKSDEFSTTSFHNVTETGSRKRFFALRLEITSSAESVKFGQYSDFKLVDC